MVTLESDLNAVNLLVWLLQLEYLTFVNHDMYFLELFMNMSPDLLAA